MPLLPSPTIKVPYWQFNGHVQSIYPSLIRKVNFAYQHRERLELADGDFVDLDWSVNERKWNRLVIVTHGLEGDSTRHYVTGMAKLFSVNQFDALGWNCRSCSGEMNRLARFYHHGDASDLKAVIAHAIQKGYEEIILVGFSMGGSLTLRAVAESPEWVPQQVKAAIGFSVPCSLKGSVDALSTKENSIYLKRFLKKLGVKIKLKAQLFPEVIDATDYDKIDHFIAFDNRYTAPLHGYKDALDFYEKASVGPLLKHIQIPALIVQATNDPFLLPNCMPITDAENSPHLFLEMPQKGGHCGFMEKHNEFSWAEKRALAFALSVLENTVK
ncbi:MAG: alpha/beta hydrolase fold containing [Chitinophagaceae bacterium]|nr:MAG: alpha/beta hydrolase fold containing [Chitinophagaceae bacterium]